jgi:riboflavin kinase/FMN adenylyltransferase
VIPFDADFAKRSAEEFIDDVLVGALGATQVAIGENFRFGHKAQGDPRLLAADGRFETVVHPLLEVDGEIVSSSHIRGLVLAGEVARPTELLGAPSSCAARWCTATSAGASSAFRPRTSSPTRRSCARPRRLRVPRRRPPGGGQHRRAPDVQTGRGELIEAYLLDFDGDLYGSGSCAWSSSRACAASGASTTRGADRADARDVSARASSLAAARARGRRRRRPNGGALPVCYRVPAYGRDNK